MSYAAGKQRSNQNGALHRGQPGFLGVTPAQAGVPGSGLRRDEVRSWLDRSGTPVPPGHLPASGTNFSTLPLMQ